MAHQTPTRGCAGVAASRAIPAEEWGWPAASVLADDPAAWPVESRLRRLRHFALAPAAVAAIELRPGVLPELVDAGASSCLLVVTRRRGRRAGPKAEARRFPGVRVRPALRAALKTYRKFSPGICSARCPVPVDA
jgi:hypothetical protein